MLPSLLFITNPHHSDPEEDLFLAEYLSHAFALQMVDPVEAVAILPQFRRCLIRNAWPSRQFVKEFQELKRLCEVHQIKSYNTFHRNAFIEDKTYLLELYRDGYPVIPTIDHQRDLPLLPEVESYIIKPKNGCSSHGVESLTREELLVRELNAHLIQPEIDFIDERSFYFIDDRFEYAMVSAGKQHRWELTEYKPSESELQWAQKFVTWNQMPYGLQRIDGCRLPSGEMLLMEVEDSMPMLTLSDLTDSRREEVLASFTKSLQTHLL
ncbi:hypothetical protein KBA73_01245 [Patescibacteria group bacterium]|nr:hypothetical protein [Patescibacteria group bacterium]